MRGQELTDFRVWGGSEKPPAQTDALTEGPYAAALWNLPGFYNGLYLSRCRNTIPSLLPLRRSGLLTCRCVLISYFIFIFSLLLFLFACWLLKYPQTSAPCEVWRKPDVTEVKAAVFVIHFEGLGQSPCSFFALILALVCSSYSSRFFTRSSTNQHF